MKIINIVNFICFFNLKYFELINRIRKVIEMTKGCLKILRVGINKGI